MVSNREPQHHELAVKSEQIPLLYFRDSQDGNSKGGKMSTIVC